MADVPSRLSSGQIYYKGGYISITKYRDIIFARSLYSLDNQYKNTNKFSLRNKSNVASSISTVLNVIPQYNRMQVNRNLLGNTYDAFRDEGSALAKIGLVMLGKQMAYNSAMNLSVKYLPSVDISQALKGNIKGVFKFNKDNTITVEDKDARTFGDKIVKCCGETCSCNTGKQKDKCRMKMRDVLEVFKTWYVELYGSKPPCGKDLYDFLEKKIGKPTRGRGYVGFKLVLELDSDDEDFEANSI
jgi:hypothetical protein